MSKELFQQDEAITWADNFIKTNPGTSVGDAANLLFSGFGVLKIEDPLGLQGTIETAAQAALDVSGLKKNSTLYRGMLQFNKIFSSLGPKAMRAAGTLAVVADLIHSGLAFILGSGSGITEKRENVPWLNDLCGDPTPLTLPLNGGGIQDDQTFDPPLYVNMSLVLQDYLRAVHLSGGNHYIWSVCAGAYNPSLNIAPLASDEFR